MVDEALKEPIATGTVHFPRTASQRGVALAMLLWFLAALSLLAGGIVMQARVDIKLTQLHGSKARAEAAGDGAIQLALADLHMLQGEDALQAQRGFRGAYSVGGYQIAVVFQPLAGMVDLNKVPLDLLVLLFSTMEDLGENGAREIADHVIEWRSSKKGAEAELEDGVHKLRHGRFEAIEDLLLVEGVDRQMFDAVRDVIYVSQSGQGGVDWASAPSRVLQAFGLSADEAGETVTLREQSESGVGDAPAELNLNFQERSETSSFRVDAIVTIGDEVYVRRRWVNTRRSGRDGLPWMFFRTEPGRSAVGGRATGASH